MIDYIKRHEHYIEEMLKTNPDQEAIRELLAYHEKQISWVQHERLAHLITMMFVCLFFLLSFGFTLVHPSLPCAMLTALLLILTVAYIFHYYRLENNVQRWYSLSNQIRLDLLQLK